MNSQETLFIMIHDAWHGSWAWQPVITSLEQRGWSAAALDLPGRGPSPHTGDLSLSGYADAVVRFVRSGQAPRLVLVGHGTGGAVMQLAAERLGLASIATLVFVQGYILKDGETIAGQLPPDFASYFKSLAEAHPQNRVDLNVLADFWRSNIINDDPSRANELLARLVPEPAALFFDPIRLEKFFVQTPPCAYISFNEDMSLPSGDFHPGMPNKLGQKYRHVNINAGHEGILTKPREVAESLIFLATQGV